MSFPGTGVGKPKIPSKFFEKNLKYIFRNDPGHLIDTPANRKLLLDVAKDPKNFMGVDKFGKSWHAKMQKDGSQVWAFSYLGLFLKRRNKRWWIK